MRRILILLAFTSCANPGDPHKFGSCGTGYAQQPVECEAACAGDFPQPMDGSGCDSASSPNREGVMYACGTLGTLTWDDGVRGCCKNEIGSDGNREIFAECK